MKFLERNPMLMICIGILGISMSAIFVRFTDAPSAVIACYRLLWTTALLTPAVLCSKEVRAELRTLRPRTLLLSALSGVLLAVHFTTWFESLKATTVASSTVIVCTECIWVTLGYCLFLHGSITRKKMAVMAVILLGSLLMAWSDFGQGRLWGDILAVIAAVAVAGYTLLGRMVRREASTTVYTFIVYGFCALVLVGWNLFRGIPLLGYTPNNWQAALALAVFSTLLGHSIFSWCLKFFSPSFVSSSKLCEPVIAGVMAAILFGEIPAPVQLVGSILVLGGVIQYSRLECSER